VPRPVANHHHYPRRHALTYPLALEGEIDDHKGAASFVAEAITTARAVGATGVLLARMDSAFDSHAVVSTCVRAGVRFSITTKQT
jgi:hypothetical protein